MSCSLSTWFPGQQLGFAGYASFAGYVSFAGYASFADSPGSVDSPDFLGSVDSPDFLGSVDSPGPVDFQTLLLNGLRARKKMRLEYRVV